MAEDGNEDLYEVEDEPTQYSKTEMPDENKQNELIELSKENIDSFRTAIIKIINDNSDKFNVLELNKENDENNTIMTKESFATTFEGTFKTELLNIIFDLIDENKVGTISNAALISFINNKTKHPRFQTTKIDSRWLLNTIKQMNFGEIDLNSDNKISLDEMTKFFTEKNVQEDIVKLVFEDIVQDQDDKDYITYKTFFGWRDKQFNPQKIRSWSHTLSQTVVLTGLEDLLKEISDNGDDFEVVDHDDVSGETKSNNDEEEFQQIQNVDTSVNQTDLLNSICDIMQLDKDDVRNDKIEDVIKTEFQKLQYQLADATLEKIKNTKKAAIHEEDAKLMKTEVIKHKAATKQMARELSDIVGRDVNTDDPKELLDVIKELQNKLSDAIQDKKKLENQLDDQEELRFQVAKLENQLGDHKLAMKKLKKELAETLGTHKDDDDPEVVNELFKKLQYQLAEEKLEIKRARRASVAMKEKLEKANYELSDERYQRLQLKDSIQTILDLDLNEIADIESVKDLVSRLQEELSNEYGPSDKMKLNDESEQAQLAKADEAIKKVDIEEELKNLEDDDDDADYMKITDINKLRRIVKSLKTELRASRTNHLAVSETKTHLEVQTFDLQTKLTVEKKKYSKLLRMSQQMANFDPKMLQMDDEEDGDHKDNGYGGDDYEDESADHMLQHTIDLSSAANAYAAGDMEMSDGDGDDNEDGMRGYDSDTAQSVNINPDVEHKEEWTGTAQELENKITRLQDEIMQFKQENETLKQDLAKTRKQSTVFEKKIETLQSTNRQHRRRESEVFTQIGADAKDVVAQYEELEQQRREMEDKELQLQYLKAEKQRMQIAYEHAKSNADKAKKQAADMRNKIKELENKAAAADEVEQLKVKLKELEETAEQHQNLELELAFYKAEKLRMDVKFDVKERSLNETRAANKELQKEIKTEKDKVRRLSKQIEISDIEALNASRNANGDQKTEQEWNAEMEQLKQKLANEQMEKSALVAETRKLQQRLSNAESTNVNQLLKYTNNEQVPPPPDGEYNPDDRQEKDEDDDEDDDDEDEVSDLEQDAEEDEDGDDEYDEEEDERDRNNMEQEMETLKFKLANAELQNAQLKRRVSIAGMEKEALSLLWEQPRVTIQMVSEFIERLPLKHKEKIWARHATGQYIAKNKILHTLHSFVALCIKIKDRTAVAPSRHDIEKKLVPFADVIRQRTENANGMSLEEFNQELHFWILEPVSGLVMTSDEQRQWMEEIDALREELVKAQKEKLRIQRKSQMDLTVLLDKMKGFEQSDNSEVIDDLKAQIDDLQKMNDDFQEELADKNEEINRLTEENQTLIAGRDKARDSEEDEDEDEEQDEEAPQLIDESQQKSLSEFRALQNEDEYAEERLEFYQNDSNVTKNQTYVGWKRKAQTAKKQIETLERERKQSVEQLQSYRKQVEQLQSAKQAESSKHESTIQQYQAEIQKFKKKYQESDKIRKDSISTLHDNLFAKLLEAEAEHEEMVADYKQQIGKLQKANKAFETSMNSMATTKVDTIQRLDSTIQELRESVSALSKQVELLKRKNDELENRTTIQTLSSSFAGFF